MSDINLIAACTSKTTQNENLAEWTYERVQSYIQDFEKTLNLDNQIGLKLVSFGNQGSFYIEEIAY